MSNPSWHINRRTALRGIGTTMALPLMDVMETASAAPAKAPTRSAFIFFANGKIMPDWRPEGEGTGYKMAKNMQPLAAFREDMTVFSGLTANTARANGDGPGDHARCSAAFLTAAQPFKTSGANIRLGTSVDQAIAQKIGEQTSLPSLELGIDAGRNVGRCDSGYSCAYSANISWKSATTPMAKEVNPRLVFERLFGETGAVKGVPERAKRDLYTKSILDFVAEDAKALQQSVGTADRRKLDEYFTSIRDIELRVARAQDEPVSEWRPDYQKPDGTPSDMAEHVRLMNDMIVVAFQGDLTRVASLMLGNGGSNRSYKGIGVPEGHHSLSHHRNDPHKVGQISKIDNFHARQFAYLLGKLKSVPEGNSNLLDNSMILYGSAISDANRHDHADLPIILAGRGGGTLSTGKHIVHKHNTPLANLFLEIMDRAGAKADKFGDSTGRLGGVA
jgi:hypothetical protein